MATYYVTQAGSGNGSGSSYENSESVANHNADTFAADDIIYLCDTITSQVTPPSSGTDGHQITYRGDYAGHAGIVDRNGGGNICIAVYLTSYLTFSHLTIKDSTYIGIWSSDDTKQNGIIIEYCDFSELAQGLSLHGDDCQIRYCTFTGNSGYPAIEFRDINNSHSSNFLIEYNTFTNIGGGGYTNAGIMYDSDTFADNSDFHQGITRYNYFNGVAGRAIDGFLGNSYIYYNVIANVTNDAAGSAIAIEINGKNNLIANNIIYESANYGIFVNSDPVAGDVANIIKNNIIYSTSVNHIVGVSAGTVAATPPVFDNNVYWMGSGGEVKYYWDDADHTFTNWKVHAGDANSIEADPLFVSATNFRLQSGSPCRNAGVDLGLTQDFKGTKVPCGSNPDMGAFEFVGYPDNIVYNFVA